jgi:DNA-binding response OmpR family regulator
MNTHSQILVVSRDQMLLQTRRLILGTYFEVEAAGRLSEAGSILAKRDFDLIVLCDTLSDSECQQIAQMVRDQRPQPKLLSLLGPGTKEHERHVGRKVALPGGPLQLLKECADALG